ncbi:MAG: response regulator [Desulfobacterales bacterium]|nr:MAG: response regulator [Desulfobacterales bacterium]
MKLKRPKKFSSYLMATFVVFVSLSVIVILGALHRDFGKRVESEFYEKLLAQKGQVEIILKNRFSKIHAKLWDLGSDNIIRVTLMLGAKAQLIERVTQNYQPADGIYCFVKKIGESALGPDKYPGLDKKIIDFALAENPYGDILEDGDSTRLLWLFSTSVMHQTRRMGTAYVLYDMAQDNNLMTTIHQTVDGDIAVFKYDRLFNFSNGISWPLDAKLREQITFKYDFQPLSKNVIVSKLAGFDNLYFQSSLASLINEKRKVTLWMGVFSIVILAVSTVTSVFLGKKMVKPLREMTKKAIQISEGQKDLLFETSRKNYWEFNQLSQAFNYMLRNLKHAEEHSRYKELFENVDDAVYILDQTGNILEANEAAYSRLGYSRENFFSLNLTRLIPPDDANAIIETLGKKPETQYPLKLILETCHYATDGNSVPVEIHSRAITYRGRNVILNVARDVSERIEAEEEKKQLEAQLTHAQKMEAIGTLAGGVAHDFNNLLMGIQGYISLMRLDTDPEDPHDKYLRGIEENVMSAANLTEQLLGFARKGKYTPRSTNLNFILEKSARMFTRTRKEITVHQRCDENIRDVEVDQGQIEQVLINLYLNAWHAMPDGGDLFIQTENVVLSDEYCMPYELPGGNYVKVSVTDTGIGMNQRTMDRIFEPFFTTKEVGKGTGLGLASAYGIIKNHNGIIRVYSEEGHGATFSIYLPAAEARDTEVAEVKSDLVKGSETILLVDDEEGPIMVEELMLKELGYKVLPARSGKEAIELYEANRDTLGLVALDMIMPEMSGRETYERLKEIDPDVKVLLVSGYSLNKQIEELIAMGCNGFIQKPFDILQLSQKLREVLDADQQDLKVLDNRTPEEKDN